MEESLALFKDVDAIKGRKDTQKGCSSRLFLRNVHRIGPIEQIPHFVISFSAAKTSSSPLFRSTSPGEYNQGRVRHAK